MDPVRQLHEEFRAREEAALERLAARREKDLRNATIAGAVAGLVAVLLTASVTRQSFAWHSFLFEALFGAAAGHALARLGGGVLWGVGLFAAAYLAAFLLRALGLDPSVLFAASDWRAATAANGHVMALAVLVGSGALIGHVIEDG